MSNRLVIFGCGYLGSAIAADAVQRGFAVTALTRNPAKTEILRQAGVKTVIAELAGEAWHHQVEGGPELVLNCVSSGGGGLDSYRQSYVAGMASILAWAERHGRVGTFVYTSSTSVYPQADGAEVNELSVTGGSERAELLLQAETRLRHASGACRRAFILRLAGIYGPGRHHLLNQVRAGEIPGAGDYRLNLAHRDDISRAVWACFSAPETVGSDTFNVADDEPTAKSEVAQWLASRLKMPTPVFSGESQTRVRASGADRVVSNARLKTILGWRPIHPSFREGYASLLSL